MPNRVIRDWTTSVRVEKLSPMAELFLVRLIMKADDYGAYWGDSRLLNANLFPLRKYHDKKVAQWRDECIKADIICKWKSKTDGREYVIIIDFGQRLRQMKKIFPRPDSDLLATRGQSADKSLSMVSDLSDLKQKRNETETKQNPKVANARIFELPFESDQFLDAWNQWEKHRREIHHKLTISTAKKQLAFLGARAEEEAIAIINQSITQGWQGLFELKNNKINGARTKHHAESLAEDFALRHGTTGKG